MAKLQIPGVSPLDVPGGPSISAPSQAISPALNIGQQAIGLGQNMVQYGNDFAQKALAATDEAVYQSTSSKAMTELNQRVQERLNKPFNDDGTPNFDTMQTDIDKIGQEVTDKYRSTILRPEILNKYNQSMNELTQRQRIIAQEKTRQQQESYARGNLQTYTDGLLTAALNDDMANLPFYNKQVGDAIDQQVANGVLSYEEGVRAKEAQKQLFTTGKLSVVGKQDPSALKAMMEDQPTVQQLGLNELERQKLLQVADAGIRDQQHQQAVAQKEQQRIQKEAMSSLDAQFELGILTGRVGESEITDAYNKGQISIQQYTRRLKQVYSARGESEQDVQTLANIATDVADGAVLGNKYSSKDLDKSFNNQVAMLKRGDGKPITLIDKAVVAAKYKAPIASFAAEIKGTLLSSSNPQQVMQAVQAFDVANQLNPLSVSGVDNETRDMIATLATRLSNTNTNPQEIIQQTRDSLTKLTPDDKALLKQKAQSEDLFKVENIDELANKVFQGEKWFFQSKGELGQDTRALARTLVMDAYIRNGGNKEAAIKAASYATKGIIGESNVNGKKTVMQFPPEQFMVNPNTGQRFTSEEITGYLTKMAEPVLSTDNPNIPKIVNKTLSGDTTTTAITSKDLYLKTYGRTALDLENPSYGVWYKDPQTGQEHPLQDKYGRILTFSIGREDVAQQSQTMLDEAQRRNNDLMGIDPNTAAPGQATMQSSPVGTWKEKAAPTLQQRLADPQNLPPKANVNKVQELSLDNKKHDPLTVASALLGTGENAKTRTLASFLSKGNNRNIDPRQVPWCAAFVNSVLRASGREGTGSLAARSFLNYGTPVTKPTKGDIVVFSRGSDPSKGHVGFVAGIKDGNVLVLGGNQNDQVSVKAYPMSKVLGFRRVDPDQLGPQQ